MSNVICPVACEYCMASKIQSRSKYWENDFRFGINKSCFFINRFPNDPPLKDMDIPWDLLDGEYVGFQGATDCFWDIYEDDLAWLLEKIKETNIRKLVLTTKIPINSSQIKLLKNNPVLVIYSLTGLDALEKTRTIDRIKALEELKENNIETHSLIHPYIHGFSDLSFLPLLHGKVSIKGFRYNPSTMISLQKHIPMDVLNQYVGNESEEFVGKEFLENKIRSLGLQIVDLKQRIQEKPQNLELNKDDVIQQVYSLVKKCVISSSEADMKVLINYIINRRLGIV